MSEIKYVRCKLDENDVVEPDNMLDEIIAKVKKAKQEAIRRGIEANAIAIDDDLYYSHFNNGYEDVPMICGLKILCKDGCFPDNVSFALLKADHLPETKQERLTRLERENERLKEKLQEIYNIVGDLLCQE